MNGQPDPYCDLILPGRLIVDVVTESQSILAFRHPSPSFFPVQILAIPKVHIPSLADLPRFDESIARELVGILASLSEVVTSQFGAARVVSNMGSLQHSKHMHWHVVSDPTRRRVDEPKDEADVQWRRYWAERPWLREAGSP